MFVLRRTLLVALALLTSACAYNDHFDNRTARFDIAAAQSRDGMILTNIIRASHAEPLSFVQLGQISGTNSAQATFGLPSLILGPHSTVAATAALQAESIFGANPAGGNGFVGNSANISGSTNFLVTPQESKEFYHGLLSEVDMRTLEFFVHQGVARELLFYLFTDRLIEERNGQRRELRNDPLDPEFPRFQHYVQLAMDYGLSSEPTFLSGHAKSAENKAESTNWQLCFNALYKSANAPPAVNSPTCGAPVVSADPRMVSFIARDGSKIQVKVLPRSAFAIFQYLGRIVAAGDQGNIRLHSTDAIGRPPLRDEYLFALQEGSSGPCFLSTTYEGRQYCVPQDGAANTKRIIGLLTQLVALNTSIIDIPVSPTVRILQ